MQSTQTEIDVLVFINGYFHEAFGGPMEFIGDMIEHFETAFPGERISFRVYRLGSTALSRG